MRCRLRCVVIDEPLHPKPRRGSAYRQAVNRFASSLEVLDAGEDDLGAWKPVELLL